MPEVHTNFRAESTTTSNMDANVTNYSVDTKATDAATGQDETEWVNTKASQYLGYYKTIPELKKSIDALAIWTVGRGITADPRTETILENITGWGEDTFNSICFNLFITKKIYGDAFAEIIRDEETQTLINLKPLDPGSIKIIVDSKGMIKRYEQFSKNPKNKGIIKFEPKDMLHLCNERVADEIHGTSIIEACEWTILARNEAMSDWKKVLHRNIVPARIIEVDSDDPVKLASVKAQYEAAINKGEVIVVPKGSVMVNDSSGVLQDSLATIKYYENFFYQAVGVPKIIMGGSEEFTESSSKIAYLTFAQIYKKEQTEFEADFWNQVYLRIEFDQPISLQNEMLSDNSKDGQTIAQPNDMIAGRGE